MKIVLAEDQAPTARVMKLALVKLGFDVELAANGQEALQCIQAEWPDALITDIEMPVMDGQELCRQLEEQFPDRTFPIYIITSVTDLVHRTWTADINDLFFIEKPVSVKRLADQLSSRLAD